MGAGKSELLAVYTLRQAADDHQPGGGRGNGFGEACEPDPVGASRRVPGGVCAALYGFGGTDCGAKCVARADGVGDACAGSEGRGGGSAVHRGSAEVVETEFRVGEVTVGGLGAGARQAEVWPDTYQDILRKALTHGRTFLSFCCKRVQVMEGQRFIVSDKWEGTESVVEGFSPKNPDLPQNRCGLAKLTAGEGKIAHRRPVFCFKDIPFHLDAFG